MCLPVKHGVFKVEREWEHAGLQCAVTLTKEHGHRCGYVRVPPTHKLFGVARAYDEEGIPTLEAHGGINFAELEPCEHADGAGWWFGFDCAHLYDLSVDPDIPDDQLSIELAYKRRIEARMTFAFDSTPSLYRRLDYVVAECNSLAEQLAAL